MIPLLRADEMRDADRDAAAKSSVDALVRRAGTAVALEVKRLLGTCYGARVAVLAGPGLNGADGRVAAEWLRERGSQVSVVDVRAQPASLSGYDLVVDAAYALGCSRDYLAPDVGDCPIVAVDLPSGVEADSGRLMGAPLRATVTVALGALKYAHVTGPSVSHVGEIRFRGLGIVASSASGLVEDGDLSAVTWPERNDHKWRHAVAVFAGSPSMPGAASLVAAGAASAGASMIRLKNRGSTRDVVNLAPEVVRETGELDSRVRAVVAGPGLGAGAPQWLKGQFSTLRSPTVLDADALDRDLITELVTRAVTVVVTPHDGEFVRLTGGPLPENRLEATRALARELGCVVLLKGPHTIVAAPGGEVRVVTSGTAALATAGTGDVLAGMIGGLLARGHDALSAAGLAAHLHGRAGSQLAPFSGASALAGAVRDFLAGSRL